ncbi:GntR family transcriptional regulator [Brevibacillus centrosporus]|uniref:Regulatory protein, gntR family n=1 Tax=Brevibacillus centrosporus TaxID=54910 RepID=A0A1I4AKK9_9BACL|nr:hypothetical protein BCE02nite_21240 [Brevibacillus centrosporus]SFK56246.1 regulatory protein, gntR family [Brevibacillus centrosporus]
MTWITIDRDKPIPLTRQLYTELRGQILRGDRKAQDKLPSTRKMAEDLGISRNVVIEAYEQLFAEGYMESRRFRVLRFCRNLFGAARTQRNPAYFLGRKQGRVLVDHRLSLRRP